MSVDKNELFLGKNLYSRSGKAINSEMIKQIQAVGLINEKDIEKYRKGNPIKSVLLLKL